MGVGTVFRFRLPALESDVGSRAESVEEEVRGTGRVLIIDDEPTILRITAKLVRSLGYEVEELLGARSAVERMNGGGPRPDLILLDLVMPDIPGPELFPQLRERWPGVAVLLTTGLAIDGQVDGLLHTGNAALIRKPFDRRRLSVAMAEVLGRSRA